MPPTVVIEFPYTVDGMKQAQQVADQYGGKVSTDAGENGPLKPGTSGLNQSLGSGAAPSPDASAGMAPSSDPMAGMGMSPDPGAGLGAAPPPPPDLGGGLGASLHQHLGGELPHSH